MTKRAFDLAVAGLALLLLSPLLLAVSVLVKIDSRGPVMFRQSRVGRGGELFRIHKFRTMRADSQGPAFSLADDRRVTRVGQLLRKTKIDELPQLIDVVSGSMSIVGPRPEVPRYVSLWPEDRRRLILSIRPGITDPASIELRHESDLLSRAADPERYYVDVLLPHKTEMYVDYVRRRSFMTDLRVIARTTVEVTRRR